MLSVETRKHSDHNPTGAMGQIDGVEISSTGPPLPKTCLTTALRFTTLGVKLHEAVRFGYGGTS